MNSAHPSEPKRGFVKKEPVMQQNPNFVRKDKPKLPENYVVLGTKPIMAYIGAIAYKLQEAQAASNLAPIIVVRGEGRLFAHKVGDVVEILKRNPNVKFTQLVAVYTTHSEDVVFDGKKKVSRYTILDQPLQFTLTKIEATPAV